MGKFQDLAGQRFGKLTVIKRIPNDHDTRTLWECLCDCGKTAIVAGGHLKDGHTTSCGCVRADNLGKNNTNYKHGMSHTRIHGIWATMKQRCTNPQNPKYKNYGGRGIKICDEWLNDSSNFIAWAMANGYSDDLSIDRIDVNGDYCPKNCRWATNTEQAFNRTDNRLITYMGETKPLGKWVKQLGLNYKKVESRINSYNWSAERAFTTP